MSVVAGGNANSHLGRDAAPLPLISVITPFYNTADGLQRCIESVIAQSHQEFEYLLVDNRSTDGSGEIARKYAASDGRIRYIYFNEHIPQGPNYNRALRQISARAEFCKIVQADDYIHDNCLEEMIKVAMRYPSVGVVGAIRRAGDKLDPHNADIIDEFSLGKEICKSTLRGDVFAFGSPTSVMYRADLVRSRPVFYNPNAMFDDTDVAFDLLRESDFGFCRQLLTYTTRDANSKLGRIWSYDFGLLYQFMTAHRIGAAFFTETEAIELCRNYSLSYYEQLVRSLVRRADRFDYLRFHRAVLRDTAAMRLSIAEGAHAFARLLCRALKSRLISS
jgi:glycosyltransferase involved in cell wall biosynthesis